MNLAIIQARMSSTRLPGKVCKQLHGKPMLIQLFDRLKRSKQIHKIVVATSDQKSDAAIVQLCRQNNIDVFAGPLDDVLARFYYCAERYCPDNILRVTGDCPLLDPLLVDQAVCQHMLQQVDYTSNCQTRSYPDGQDIEVFTFAALQTAFHKARKPSEREHVTPFIRDNEEFSCSEFVNSQDLSQLRMSVDYPEDFEFVEAIYVELANRQPDFGLTEITQLLDQKPELLEINQHFEFNEGYQKSLAQDKDMGF